MLASFHVLWWFSWSFRHSWQFINVFLWFLSPNSFICQHSRHESNVLYCTYEWFVLTLMTCKQCTVLYIRMICVDTHDMQAMYCTVHTNDLCRHSWHASNVLYCTYEWFLSTLTTRNQCTVLYIAMVSVDTHDIVPYAYNILKEEIKSFPMV